MKKKILMISTGGTIAMSVDEEAGGAVPDVGSQELINMAKEVAEFADVETMDFSSIPSGHMSLELMLDLSKLVNENIQRDDVDGVVITHGTDTVEETSYFLNLVTNSSKPIVLVGSMRNNSELGYEGAANIANAILTAACPESRDKGVLVAMNGKIHSASYITKMHTTSVETFDSLTFGALGYVSSGIVKYYRNILERQYIETDRIEPKIALVKCAAGIGADVVDFYIDNGYKGIVIEAFGAGNVFPDMVNAIKRAIEKGIPVVLSSRCPEGGIEPVYAYEGGVKILMDLGCISGGIQLGHKCRVKLAILLGKTQDVSEIKNQFESYLA